MLKIHKATIWDIAALWRFFHYALSTDFTYFSPAYINHIRRQNSLPRFIAALFHRNRMILVAKKGSQIVGYAIGAVPQPGEGELYWLFVHPDYRGQNLGLKLLAAAFKHLRCKRAKKVRIVTYNIDQYYQRQGFQYVGTQSVDGLELKLMEYPLFPGLSSQRISAGYVRPALLAALLVVITAAGLVFARYPLSSNPSPLAPFSPSTKNSSKAGRVIKITESHFYRPEEVTAGIKQNYGDTVPVASKGVTKVVFTFSSLDLTDKLITIYARAYIPEHQSDAPVFVIAPGTTGIGDDCSGSLEQPHVRNWANYQSHALAYAAQGYVTVVPDYEGMRDPTRLHHYMVGELEGRAVLDSIRATRSLPQAKPIVSRSHVLVSGYSQGGHSVFWADKINSVYAPDITISGVIGWGPVMDVQETWQDITKGANINWFGPYVLLSYADFYRAQYNLDKILLPKWRAHLLEDVTSNCIDTNIAFWGRVPEQVYTPEFLQDLRTGSLLASRYGSLGQNLAANIVGDQTTASAKLINFGVLDNVVLASQQASAKNRLCASSRGPVAVVPYPQDNHYTVMKASFHATLAWMKQARSGRVTQPCPTPPA